MRKKKLLILSTHPIQYNAPLFQLLASRGKVDLMVFYTWGQSQEAVYDPGFGAVRQWDIPLLEGYAYEFIPNTSKDPGSHHFSGIVNPDLNDRIAAFKPDALLVYGWSFSSHLRAMRYAKSHGIPVWFRGDSNLLDEPVGWSVRKTLRRVFLSWVFKRVDRAFYVGDANKKYFLAHGLKSNQLTWAPHAVDNSRFEDDQADYESKAIAWRRELGIDPAKPVFLFAGKFEPKKNVRALVNAFLSLSDAQLIMVGNGVLESELKSLAAACKHIFWIPFQNQSIMPIVYRLGDVFILPSVGPGETWGLAMNEAMACGRPVIAGVKCGGATDLIASERIGEITTGSVDDIQRCVRNMLQNPLSDRRSFVLSHIQQFSFSRIAAAYEQAFE